MVIASLLLGGCYDVPSLARFYDAGVITDAAAGDDLGTTHNVSVFAGTIGGAGNAEGTTTTARFDQPTGVAADDSAFYVVDTAGCDLFRIDRGTREVTRLAGVPYRAGTDGTHFAQPRRALKIGDLVYITDGPRVRAWSSGNPVTDIAPNGLFGPVGMAVDDNATSLYVVDQDYNDIKVIQPLGPSPSLSPFAGLASPNGSYADGPIGSAGFSSPTGIALTSAGGAPVALVTDQNNRLIREISINDSTVTTYAGQLGDCIVADGTGGAATVCTPSDIVCPGSICYFSDEGTLRTIDPATAQVVTVVDTLGVPQGIVAYDDAGHTHVLVADSGRNVVVDVDPVARTTSIVAGTPPTPGETNGARANATFTSPGALCADGDVLYVADASSPPSIRSIASDVVMTVPIDTVDAGPALSSVSALVAGGGTIYVADGTQSAVFSLANGTLTKRLDGSTMPTGSTTGLADPEALALDGTTLYIASAGTNDVRALDTVTGAYSVVDLQLASHPYGCGSASGLLAPVGLAVDTSRHRLYIAGRDNCAVFVYPLDGGPATLLAGAGQGAVDGASDVATFDRVGALALDVAGDLYVADPWNAMVRRIDAATSAVSTVAGTLNQFTIVPGTAPARINRAGGLAATSFGLVASMPSENSLVLIQ